MISLTSKNAGEISLEGRRNFLIKLSLGIASVPFASFIYGITLGEIQLQG